MNRTTLEKIDYSNLIKRAIKEPGELSKCYSLFHDYSLLNTFYVLRQLHAKGLPVEPIKGYKAWGQLNRQVKPELLTGKSQYGYKNGIELLYPVFGYYPLKDKDGNPLKDKNGKQVFNKYVKDFNYYRWHFSASQTTIKDASKKNETMTENKFHIDIHKLCKALNIEIVDYNSIDGNCQGWARTEKRQLALNPVSEQPIETSIHEVAHIILEHHKAEYPRNIKEVEAETVAYIVLTICNNDVDLSNQRAYIQHWLKDDELTDDIAKRIMTASNKILETLKDNKE